jgi:hypothetical protein
MMSLVIVETLSENPITLDRIVGEEERLTPCLVARYVNWRYSLFSDDRHRMVCTFEAPDAESVRLGYRKANVPFNRMWSGELIELNQDALTPLTDRRMVIEFTYSSANSGEWSDTRTKLLHNFSERGIVWLKSYLSLDRKTLIGELIAPDLEAVQIAQRQSQTHCDRLWSADVLSPETWEKFAASEAQRLGTV